MAFAQAAALLYVVGFPITWFILAHRWISDFGDGTGDLVQSAGFGFLGAIVWPLLLIGLIFGWLVSLTVKDPGW